MPSPESIYDELEDDHRNRESELRLIERLLQEEDRSERDRDMLKRSLVLLSYAHLEGFCKFALLAYTSALNSLELACSNASYPIAAATLSKVFAALRDPKSKHEAFRRTLPDDAYLHLSAREHVFLESYDTIVQRHVEIPDDAVDTQSNLSAAVLKKMLFQLGLNYPAVDTHRGNLHKLLNLRNAIAHGARLKSPSDKEVADYTATILEVMRFVKDEIFAALKRKLYLRNVPAELANGLPEGAGGAPLN
jgi:hypothetical protein